MNVLAGIRYAEKHYTDIMALIAKVKALMPAGGSTDKTLQADILALVNKHAPGWNPNGLIEDTLALFGPSPVTPSSGNAPIRDASQG